MVKVDDEFWTCVVEANDGDSKCKYCGYVFAVGTLISTIKSHLSGVKGCGVDICEKAPADVQEAAYLAVHGTNKKLKAMPSSSNDTISTSLQEQADIWTGEVDRVPMEVQQRIEQEVGEERTSSVEDTGNDRDHMNVDMMQPIEGSISVERNLVGEPATREEALKGFDEWSWLYKFSC